MKKRILGNGLEVSQIGDGAMGLSHAYGPSLSEKEFHKVIHAALDACYTFFDTAEVYGTHDDPHHNERELGKALKGIRDQVLVATKCGIRFDESVPGVSKPLIVDARPEVLRASLEGSLERLQTDHIDLYYLHRVDPKTPIEVVAQTMKQFIQEGKILHWGLSEADAQTIERAHAICPLTAVQSRYSMMARKNEELFPTLERLHIGFVAFSPMANGYLSGAYHKGDHFDQKTDYRSTMPQFQAGKENVELFNLLEKYAQEKQATKAQISLAWMMNKKDYIVPIPGSRHLDRLQENAKSSEIVLSQEEVSAIDHALDQMSMSHVFGGSKIVK